MNLLKSLFISVYFTLLMVVIVMTFVNIAKTVGWVPWFGVLLTTLPVGTLLCKALLLRNTQRTSSRLLWMLYLSIVGCVLTFAFDMALDDPLPMALAVGGVLMLVLYCFWYSSFDRQASDKLQHNQSLPIFELTDLQEQVVSSSVLLTVPSLLVFYRGNWCPFCVAQIKEICGQYNQLAQLGVNVVFISPQPLTEQAKISKMFDCQVSFMRDVNNKAASVLDIKHPFALPAGMQVLGYENDAPLPTVILTDSGGKVLYKSETDNYRVRPEPQTFIDIARAHLSLTDHPKDDG
jgi:peroxiredoxin